MGLIVLSIILAIVLGCFSWLALGNRLPFGGEEKWPPLNNIFCYGLLAFLPIYLFIFFSH